MKENRKELEAAQNRIDALQKKLAQQQDTIDQLNADGIFRDSVIERAIDGVCVCHTIPQSPYLKFIVWNYRMIELTGYSMEDINRLGWYQTLYHDPEIQKFARSRMENIHESDGLQTETWEINHQSGEKILVSMSSSLLTDADDPNYILILLHDLTEEQRLKSEARLDDLTQLMNRRGFIEEARVTFKLAAHRMQAVTFAYLDVDDLKKVNDVLGHKEGDRVLEVIGKTLLDSVRSIDVAGRLSGDEFALVLIDMKAKDAKIMLGRLHDRFNNVFKENNWDIGMSMGVITFTDFIPVIDDAIEYADSLMYKAKLDGKNRLISEEITDAIIRSVPRTQENGQKLSRESGS